jgi:hypothetical protein
MRDTAEGRPLSRRPNIHNRYQMMVDQPAGLGFRRGGLFVGGL